MTYQTIIKHAILLLLFVFIGVTSGYTQNAAIEAEKEYTKSAKKIRSKYEENAYRLSPGKAGHMGLRLWRNYENDKYQYLLLQGINHTASSLDKLITNGLDKKSLDAYVSKSNSSYKPSTEKKKRRKETFGRFPNYRLMSTKILRHVARLNELGLRHEKHDKFIKMIEAYDYKKAFTDPQMIRAWGAQLANQVYWLYNLGVADYRSEFMQAVLETYPREIDNELSKQQLENKIYTLTHIIIAASEYYRHHVDYLDYKFVVDYLRSNTDEILEKLKKDIIIEVGLSLLLVDESFPEIDSIRSFIHEKIDFKKRMILSEKGRALFAQGEHRNIIAVLLLDWKGCSTIPSSKDIKDLHGLLAESLEHM